MSEALIFASTNPQYDDRLFIGLQLQYMKIPSSNLGKTCCVQKLFLTFRTIFVRNMFSPWSVKRRASDKDLPVRSNVYLNSNHYCLEQCLPSQRIIGGFHLHLLVSSFVEQATALFPVHLIVGQNLRIQLYLAQSDDLHQNQ